MTRALVGLDVELANLPPDLRWREWMGRVEAVVFAAAEPVKREALARVVGPSVHSISSSTISRPNSAAGPTNWSKSPAANRPRRAGKGNGEPRHPAQWRQCRADPWPRACHDKTCSVYILGVYEIDDADGDLYRHWLHRNWICAMPRAALDDTHRMNLRIKPDVKARLMRAAALRQTDLTSFVTQSALREADAVILEAEHIELSERDSLRVLDLLENPPAPNDRLRAAIVALPIARR